MSTHTRIHSPPRAPPPPFSAHPLSLRPAPLQCILNNLPEVGPGCSSVGAELLPSIPLLHAIAGGIRCFASSSSSGGGGGSGSIAATSAPSRQALVLLQESIEGTVQLVASRLESVAEAVDKKWAMDEQVRTPVGVFPHFSRLGSEGLLSSQLLALRFALMRTFPPRICLQSRRGVIVIEASINFAPMGIPPPPLTGLGPHFLGVRGKDGR